jgi:N-acyl homoserine lactone hydrolase
LPPGHKTEMKIERLHFADVTTPPSHPTPDKLIRIFAYLVWASDGLLLFDSGIGPPHEFIDSTYRPRRSSFIELLGQQEVTPEAIDVVVNCHLHFDHCGGNQELGDKRIVVQRTELEDAKQPGYTVPEWVDFDGAQYEVVDGEYSIWDGVRVVPTPGHTRGHQSLVLETPEGRVVLAGQAADTAAGFDQGSGGWDPDLEEAGAASLQRIRGLSPRRVLFAHDDREWQPG